MPYATREPIECLSKVLDGTFVACGSEISKGPNAVFKVSFNIKIMFMVLSFKSWKLNNGVLTNFCVISCNWLKLALHKLINGKLCDFLMYMYSWDTRIWCPSGVVVSSPLANKVHFFSMLRRQKDCVMTVRAHVTLVVGFEPYASPSIWITYLVAKALGATLTCCVMK
jgi:hypothetical protein